MKCEIPTRIEGTFKWIPFEGSLEEYQYVLKLLNGKEPEDREKPHREPYRQVSTPPDGKEETENSADTENKVEPIPAGKTRDPLPQTKVDYKDLRNTMRNNFSLLNGDPRYVKALKKFEREHYGTVELKEIDPENYPELKNEIGKITEKLMEVQKEESKDAAD